MCQTGNLAPTLHGHAEAWPAMTPTAVLKREVAAKGFFAIMTGQTAHPPRDSKVFSGVRRVYLARLWQTGGDVVTLRTGETFAWAMFRVAEGITKGTSIGRRGPVGFLIVAHAT